jgi:hypothetical protein
MKFSYRIDASGRIVFQRYEGSCTVAELLTCIRRVWSDPAYSRDYGCYVDLTAVKPHAALDDLNRLVEFLRAQPHASQGRCAAVTHSPVLTACGVLYQKAMADRHAFAVFSSPEAALAFLQFDGPPPVWIAAQAEEITA